MKELEEDPPRPHLPDHEGAQDGGQAKNVIPIPPQPGPAVQETSFAPDASSELVVLAHEPIAEDSPQPSYGTITTENLPGPGSTQNDGHNKPSQARSIPPDLLRGLLMILMALDHNVMSLRSWPHATAIDGENDSGVPSKGWNTTLAYAIRTLTHLCAPGFMFLLGMGIVYFGRSRTNLGWTGSRMIRHFFVRGLVLTALSSLLGVTLSGGRIWLLNIVLVALGVDYFLVGTGWVIMSWTESIVARLVLGLVKKFDGKTGKNKIADGEDEPLLPPPVDNRGAEEEVPEGVAPDRSIILAADASWHLHNVVLLALAGITIWWNIWLSPTGGGCFNHDTHDELARGATDWSSHGSGGFPAPKSILGFRFWFYPVNTDHVLSGFPPLAWISFAILGLLYGRIILARSWSARAITAGNILAAMGFVLVFVGTRLFHVGNLSEVCLRMPEHAKGGNQYLASAASFFYLVKYPPDVAFWAFTMAVNFLFLAPFSIIPAGIAARFGKVLLVYGTSALFFYVVHLPLLGLIAEAVFIPWLGHEMDFEDVMSPGKKAIGVDNLWAFFANWAIVLVLLYPACWWYGGFKKTKGVDSIWRFF